MVQVLDTNHVRATVRAGDTERRGPSREAGVAGTGVRALDVSKNVKKQFVIHKICWRLIYT
jgi:hypothetical protein